MGKRVVVETYNGHQIFATAGGKVFSTILSGDRIGRPSLDDLKRIINDHAVEQAQKKRGKFGKAQMSLGLALADYLRSRKAGNKGRSWGPEECYVNKLVAHFGSAIKLDAIKFEEAEGFLLHSEQMKNAAESYRRALKSFLSGFKKYCDDHEWYNNWEWLTRMKFSKGNKEKAADRIVLDDLVKFLGVIDRDSQWWTIFRMMAAYGFRPKELRLVRKENWSPKERRLHIVYQKVNKNNRIIDVVKELADEIDANLARHGKAYLFVNGSGQQLGINAIFSEFRAVAAKAGIAGLYSPYSLRKFAARNLYLIYRDNAKVEHMLGHSEAVWDAYYYFDKNKEKLNEEVIWWDFESERHLAKNGRSESVVDMIRQMSKEDRAKIIAELLKML